MFLHLSLCRLAVVWRGHQMTGQWALQRGFKNVRFIKHHICLLCGSLSLSLWLYCPLDLGRFFSFLILYTVARIPWTGDQHATRPVFTHRTTQTQNKRTWRSMPPVGFETTTPVFERMKTVYALDRAATVIGSVGI
jgi:hypothetical protein